MDKREQLNGQGANVSVASFIKNNQSERQMLTEQRRMAEDKVISINQMSINSCKFQRETDGYRLEI